MKKISVALPAVVFVTGMFAAMPEYTVLPPMVSGGLSVFPVIGPPSPDADGFITLDEGLKSGEVAFHERAEGGVQADQITFNVRGARPLLLLAGEILRRGGKQDRVIAKDRILPARSGPFDVEVFRVEADPWHFASFRFESLPVAIVQPAARRAGLYWMEEQLSHQNALGVVAAINGEFIWADVFASPVLLQRYWPKLAGLYSLEAMPFRVRPANLKIADVRGALHFVEDLKPVQQSIDTEENVYRTLHIEGNDFEAFVLSSLLPGARQDQIHLGKTKRIR